jgi:hypothetical protein
MSHSAFILIILFYFIYNLFSFGVYYIQHYFQSTFFLPFDIMSHLAFIIFDITVFQVDVIYFFYVLSHSAFITIVFMSFRRYLSFQHFVLSPFLTIRRSHRAFVPFDFLSVDLFNRRRFLLCLFVGESYRLTKLDMPENVKMFRYVILGSKKKN